MFQKTPTAKMSHAEWLALRKTGIGGSDAGTVCGLNPYSSPMKLFHDKTSEDTEELDNESVRQGHDLEEYVARRFAESTGLKVRRSNYMYRSVEYPFMIADVDRLIVGEDAGLECKTASAYNADKWKDGDIPLHYIMQCCHYMAVTGKRTWYIAAVILGREFVYRKLVWNDELIARLIAAEKDFWENHVMTKKMPAPDGSQACDKLLNRYFGFARKGSSVSLTGFDEKLNRRSEIMEEIGRLQKEQNCIEQEVKLYMQDNEFAASDNYRVSWSNVETTRLDTQRIKQEKPEIYQDYAKQTVSRRFQVRAA